MMVTCLIPFLFILFAAVSAPAAEPVTIRADRLTHLADEELIIAEGGVTAETGTDRMTAGRAEFLVPDGRLTATNGVTLTRGGDRLAAERGTVLVQSGTGVLEMVEARFAPTGAGGKGPPHLAVSARRIEKRGESDYVIDGGTFTTCEGESPPWSIAAERVEMTLGGYAWGENVRFNAGGVPLLWLPRFFFPVKTERQSGLLLPRIGHSSTRGVTYAQPVYLVVSPSADLTLTPLIESRRGVGMDGEFRILRPRGGKGDLEGAGFISRDDGRTRGTLSARWVENPRGTVASRGDLAVVSDRAYLAEFGRESGVYNRDSLDSAASIELRATGGLVGGGLFFSRDLSRSPRETIHRLPALSGALIAAPIGSLPLYGALDAGYVAFSRDGADLQRAAIEPSLSVAAPLASPVWILLDAGWRLSGYRYSDGRERGEGRHRVDLSLSAPVERRYGRLRHVISPRAGIRSQGRRDHGALPSFDMTDGDRGGELLFSEITTSLERIAAGPDGDRTSRDLATLRVSHAVELSGRAIDPTALSPSTGRNREIRLEGSITPIPALSLDIDTRYDPNRPDVTSLFSSLSVDLGRGGRGALGWYHIRGKSSYLEGGVTVPLSPFTVGYRIRHSLDGRETLESVTRLDYRHQCWGVGVSWAERSGEREFMFTFTLAGVGSAGI